jgi:hypothetical protein
VVEAFIGPARADGKPITNYLEIELSPNSVLFASNITNPGLTCSVRSLLPHTHTHSSLPEQL